MNRILFILVAFFMLSPVFASPQFTTQPQPAHSENAQNRTSPPLSVEETAAINAGLMTSSPVNNEQTPAEESIQTKPSAGDIEKNSAQEPYDKSDLKKEIVPETKGELFTVAFMFVKAMLAVALCSVILYFILLFVRKNYGDTFVQKPQNNEPVGDLKSPQSESEALKVFFNQTKNH